MIRKYKALRLLGMDRVSSVFVAAVSAVVQRPDHIQFLNVEVSLDPHCN